MRHLTILAALLATAAHAAPPADMTLDVTVDVQANPRSDSRATATGGRSDARADAQGGDADSRSDARATGGDGGNARADGGDARSEQNVELNHEEVRQAPALAQGSVIPPACGAGGNAGGSRASGAGFLGFSWVTRECHRYILAQQYMALGMTETACQILNTTKGTKRAFKELGLPLPSCEFTEARP